MLLGKVIELIKKIKTKIVQRILLNKTTIQNTCGLHYVTNCFLMKSFRSKNIVLISMPISMANAIFVYTIAFTNMYSVAFLETSINSGEMKTVYETVVRGKIIV